MKTNNIFSSTAVALCLILGLSTPALADSAKKFQITLTNLTKGQPITPPVVAVHSPEHQLFHLGQPASMGLGMLATDGQTDMFIRELKRDYNVIRTAVGEGVILPGKSSSIVIEANDPRFVFTVVAMLARTNDAIVVAKDITTNLQVGKSVSVLATVYDAGVEGNSESCDQIPAPPCNSPGVGNSNGEGFIRPHEGILGVGDLLPARDAFASVAAKVVVTRIQ